MKVPMYIQVLYLFVTLASFYGQGATKNMHTNINLDMLQILIQQANDNLMYEGNISSYDPREFDEDYRHYNHLDDSKISSRLNIEIAISPEDNIEIKEVYLSSLSYIIDKTLTPKLTSMTYKVSNRRFNQLNIYLHDTIEVILDGNEDFINVSLPPSGEVSLSHSVPHPFNDNIIDGKSVPEDLINHEQQIKDEAVYHQHNATHATSWPEPKYPHSFSSPVNHTNGISVLFLIHPDLLKRQPLYKLRSSFFTPLFDKVNDILNKEEMYDGISGRQWRFYVANQPSKNGLGTVFSYTTPPADICPANYCSSNFYTLLNKMDTSQALRALKKAWKADIVLFIHNVYDPYNQVSGLAHIPTNPHDTTFKHVANGVAGYLSNYKVYPAAHELFHLIGAQHSKHNKKPGPLGHRAYIGSTKERNGDINGYRSFMAYEDVCKKATKDPYCQRYERISSRSTYVDLYGKRVPLGNSHDDNKNAVLNLQRTVQKFGS